MSKRRKWRLIGNVIYFATALPPMAYFLTEKNWWLGFPLVALVIAGNLANYLEGAAMVEELYE